MTWDVKLQLVVMLRMHGAIPPFYHGFLPKYGQEQLYFTHQLSTQQNRVCVQLTSAPEGLTTQLLTSQPLDKEGGTVLQCLKTEATMVVSDTLS
jgi:hypothetical protein